MIPILPSVRFIDPRERDRHFNDFQFNVSYELVRGPYEAVETSSATWEDQVST